MRIKKKYQGTIPENKILNIKSSSETDTYSCKYINENKDNYSTEEQVIGTWIDGKPIYKKILTFESINTNSTKQIEIDINIDNLVNILSIVKTTDETFRTIPAVAPGYNTYSIGMFYSISTNSVYIQTPSQVSITSGYIAIEYTKTTD